MPKRKDNKKILIIGSGPIVIGQACEFDYSRRNVQYQPGASLGARDSHYHLTQFTDMMEEFQKPGSSRR